MSTTKAKSTPRSSKVYVGGGNVQAWLDYRNSSDGWRWVAENADGWYINNFAFRAGQPDVGPPPYEVRSDAEDVIQQTAERFRHKNVFYETDLRPNVATQDFDQEVLTLLSKHFTVTNCCINYVHRYDLDAFAERRDALRESAGDDVPIQVQMAPWVIGGDLDNRDHVFIDRDDGDRRIFINRVYQDRIRHCQGGATDGPIGYWQYGGYQGFQNMRLRPPSDAPKHGGNASTVLWVKELNAKFHTMIMATPEDVPGPQFLDGVRDMVRVHERTWADHPDVDVTAEPHIWALSYYGPADYDACPVLPETTGIGDHIRPAPSFMGAAWWLLHHLKDSDNWP